MTADAWQWLAFSLALGAVVAGELFLGRGTAEGRFVRRAVFWSAFWTTLSFSFCLLVLVWQGEGAAKDYLAGFLKSLSLEHLLAYVLIFSAANMPVSGQYRLLLGGVVLAVGLRAAFLLLGSELLDRSHFAAYFFGLGLLALGAHAILKPGESGSFLPFASKLQQLLTAGRSHSDRGGNIKVFLACLLSIELTTLVLAMDEIPALLSLKADPFVLFAANTFGLFCLRSYYFVLPPGFMQHSKTMKAAFGGLLVFAGAKLLLIDTLEIPGLVSLVVVISVVGLASGLTVYSASRNARVKAEGS